MAPFSDIPPRIDCREVGFLVAPGFRLAALGRALSVLAEAAAREGSSFEVAVLSETGGAVGSAEGVRLRTRRGGAGKAGRACLKVGGGAGATAEIVGATLALVAPMANPAFLDPASLDTGSAARPSFSRRVRAVLDYARLHLDQPLPVRTLASVACLGTRQFVRVLHRETGQTPAKLIDTMRAEAARDLIERCSESMTRIADQVGFADAERMRRACPRRAAGGSAMMGAEEVAWWRRRVADCVRYGSLEEGLAAAETATRLGGQDALVTYHQGLCRLGLGGREAGLQLLSTAAALSPQLVASAAAGQYWTRRLRVAEGHGHEDGWIDMLDIALLTGILPVVTAAEAGPAAASPGGPAGVPRVIVQFWDTERLPDEVARTTAAMAAANPDCRHRLFGAEAAREFVGACLGPEGRLLFDACPHPAAKSDLFRAVYLFEHGGLYVDVDEVCERTLTTILDLDRYDLLLSFTPGQPSCVNNWFVAAAPRTMLLERVVSHILGNLSVVARQGADTNIWVLTGPGAWTFAVLDLALDVLAYRHGHPFARAGFLSEPCYRTVFDCPDMPYKTTDANWRRA